MKKNIFWIIGGLALLIVAVLVWRRSRQQANQKAKDSIIAELEQQLEDVSNENERLRKKMESDEVKIAPSWQQPKLFHLTQTETAATLPPPPDTDKGRQKACAEEKAAYEAAKKQGTKEAFESFLAQNFPTKAYRGKAGQMITKLK